MGAAPQMEPLGITVASVLNAKNHFEVIGLEPKRCCGAELRSAYKKTALKVHPDKCSDNGALEAFRRLQEAFKVLSDPMLHARYAQSLAGAQSRAAAAGRAQARSAAYAARSKVSKEELERQVKEMMARQSKQRPMATGQAAQKAAEDRVAKDRERQQRLEKEERARQAEAVRRREQAEKALNSARNRTPRTPKPKPVEEPPLDPEAVKAAEDRARRRAASMGFLSDQLGWAKATSWDESGKPSVRDGTDSNRRTSSARSPQQASPFGDIRSLRRAQTERTLKRPVPPSSYLPRFMREKTTVTVAKV